MNFAEAHSYDLDDTLIGRSGSARMVGFFEGKILSHHLPSYTSDVLPEIQRVTSDTSLSVIERLSLTFHSHGKVLPGVPGNIEQDVSDGIHVYGNTGRPNKTAWVDMTERTLHKGGILTQFEDIFYTPHGMKTAVSKAVALKELAARYRKVAHYDDDPKTAVYLATLFPDVQIYLIQSGVTGLLYSREEIARVPNIHRIAAIENYRQYQR